MMTPEFSTPAPDKLPAPSSTPTVLWTSRAVALATFFFGLPGGLVLAIVNWMRMGLKDKATTHLVGGAIATILFVFLIVLLPGDLGNVLALSVNLGVVFYLQAQTKRDIETFRSADREVRDAHWFSGCLIGLAMAGVFIALILLCSISLAIVGIQVPE